MPMTDEQLNQYEQQLKEQSDNAARSRLGNVGNMYANYGSPSMTNTVNSFNYDRINDYMNALGKREELAQAWQQTANQRALTAAQINNMQNEHSRGLMGLALQKGQMSQQREQHLEQLAHNKAMQEGQLAQQRTQHLEQLAHNRALQEGQMTHASNLQKGTFAHESAQESRRQKSQIDLQKQQIEAARKQELSRQTFEERHFGATQAMAKKQLEEQTAARLGTEAFREKAHSEQLEEAKAARTSGQELQRLLEEARLTQSHNQFQQGILERNQERSSRSYEARVAQQHAEQMQTAVLNAQERESYARRVEAIAQHKLQEKQLEEAKKTRKSSQAISREQHAATLDEAKTLRMTSQALAREQHQDTLAQAELARAESLAWEKGRHTTDIAEQRAARKHEAKVREQFQKAQFEHEITGRESEQRHKELLQQGMLTANAGTEAARLAWERTRHRRDLAEQRDARLADAAQRERMQRAQFENEAEGRESEQRHRGELQRESLAATRENLATQLGWDKTVHTDTMAQRDADRRAVQEQFDAKLRQSRLQDLAMRKMNLHSWRLSKGQMSHSQWLDKFNASIAHMGLQLKRDKLEHLLNGSLAVPDENATEQAKLSWMASLLSDADASEGARQDRGAKAAAAQNDAAMNRLSAEARLNQLDHSYRIGLFNQMLTPAFTSAASFI